jgi:phage/plasmid-like protein (TIGR03299 family)
MAHNLATINGKAAMAYLHQTPWHGLGQRLQGVATVAQALDAAQLNWRVTLEPVYLADGTPIPGSQVALRRELDGTAVPLGVHGSKYHVGDNVDVTKIGEPLIDLGCTVDAAGALGNGERCWMLFRLADGTFAPVPGDDVKGYFLLDWSHDGQTHISGLGTAIRVVCQNTLSMALSAAAGKKWVSIRHTASAAQRIDEAAKLMAQLMAAMKFTNETFASMAAKKLNPTQLRAFVDHVVPNTSASATVAPKIAARRETVLACIASGKGADMANQLVDTRDGGASLWAAYNGVAEYFDHVRPAEAASEQGLKNAQASALFGGNAQQKAEALTVARQLLAA